MMSYAKFIGGQALGIIERFECGQNLSRSEDSMVLMEQDNANAFINECHPEIYYNEIMALKGRGIRCHNAHDGRSF